MKILRVAFVHPVNLPGAVAKQSFSSSDDHLTIVQNTTGIIVTSSLAKPGQGDTFVPMSNIVSIGFELDAPVEKGKAK